MELKLIEEKRTNDNKYRQERYEIGDYRVEVNYIDGVREDMFVRENFNAKYAPEIYFHSGRWGEKEEKFEIQTTGYGAKEVDEIQKVIKGYQDAIEVVNLLTEKFL